MFQLDDKVRLITDTFSGIKPNVATVIAMSFDKVNVAFGWKDKNGYVLDDYLIKNLVESWWCVPNIQDFKYYFILHAAIRDYFSFELVNNNPIVFGCTCVSCGSYFPDAVPNLPNNQLKCWSCRNS